MLSSYISLILHVNFIPKTTKEHRTIRSSFLLQLIEHNMKIRTQMVALALFVILWLLAQKIRRLESTNMTVAQNVIEVENELLSIVNDHRISLGTSQLQFSVVAYEHANAHNDYMVSKGRS